MDLELRGRTAVVTGCSVGIGREIARVLAAEGVLALVIARRGDLIDQRLHPTPENQEQFARQIPLGYFGDPSDMAYLVAFLCSSRARYITGERIHVDGGLRRAI